ncbi:MAG: class I SAM-dependent methyltransferase, partial [Candidatus Thorarchaeota archaeon]
ELVQVNFDAEEIPLELESIDLGFTGFMLHEVASPTDFVSHVYRHIRKNGFFVVYDFISGNEEAFVKVITSHGMSEEHARKRYPHMCKHSANDIVKLLSTAGFEDCRMIVMDEMRVVVVGLKR